jgi:hypothetical protein
MTSDPAEAVILALVAQRGPEKSICPTEAARALAGHPADESWRRHLSATAGRIEILRKGKPVAPADARGVVRLRLLPGNDA